MAPWVTIGTSEVGECLNGSETCAALRNEFAALPIASFGSLLARLRSRYRLNPKVEIALIPLKKIEIGSVRSRDILVLP